MKNLLPILIVVCMASFADAQTFGLGPVPVQRTVIVQRQYQHTFGLTARPPQSLVRSRTTYEIPLPVSIPVVVSQPQPQAVVETYQPQIVYQQVSQPQPIFQRRWRMVQRQTCGPNGCQMTWVRVYE